MYGHFFRTPNKEDEGDLARGFLVKQGGVRKNWKKRWMVLNGAGVLCYYKSSKETSPLGTIDITNDCLDILCGDECSCAWPQQVRAVWPQPLGATCLDRKYYCTRVG